MSRQPPSHAEPSPEREQSEIAGRADAAEPSLAVRPRYAQFFRRRWFLRQFVPVAFLAVLGLVGLVTLPVDPPPRTPPLITLTGSMGSKSDFFKDERVRELLLQHHFQVNVIRKGTADAATGELDSLDFILASGQPTAELLIERGRLAGENYPVHRVFVSPIVLATYRDYAETLRAAGVATPQVTPGFDQSYYYTLDMAGFLDLVHDKKSWKDLNSHMYGIDNTNQVIAHTPSVCQSNTGASYLGLVSYVVHGRVPNSNEEATAFATEVKDRINPQGMPLIAPEIYWLPDGRQRAPIIVFYEHQYLARQLLNLRKPSGQLDGDRVLLYPAPASPAEAVFVAFNEDADRLGRLLLIDPDLRKRAVELGLQAFDPDGRDSEQLPQHLTEQGMPLPSRYLAKPGLSSDTQALTPDLPKLKKMIDTVVECPTVVP